MKKTILLLYIFCFIANRLIGADVQNNKVQLMNTQNDQLYLQQQLQQHQMQQVQQLQLFQQQSQPKQQATAKTSKTRDNDDYAPEILGAFFGKAFPAFVDIIAGEESENAAQTATGVKNFLAAACEIVSLIARNPKAYEKLMASIEKDLSDNEDFHELIKNMTRSIQMTKSSNACAEVITTQ